MDQHPIDIVLLSSVFGVAKIAEPMGVAILTASLRDRGFTVEILEPSLDGWTIDETVDQIASVPSRIVGVSMLRDKHVEDVLEFVTKVRARCPDRFLVVGGHGPSISVDQMSESEAPAEATAAPPVAVPLAASRAPKSPVVGAIVDAALTDRGKGAGDIDDDGIAGRRLLPVAPDPRCSTGIANGPSPYFDKSAEYLAVASQIDTYLIGEADDTLPALVERVLTSQDWRVVPAVAYLGAGGRIVRNPLPPKIPDLDRLPTMARDVYLNYIQRYGDRIPASVLASRGCFYRCSFCSVVKYEALQEGRNHRQRSNASVLGEITEMYESYGTAAFNFEDDNFIIKSRAGRRRLHDLCDEIIALDHPVQFTFFCRADAVDRELFAHFKQAGLTGIYFGIESVSDEDLDFFDKDLSVDQIFAALDTLLELGYSPAVDADLRIMLGYITWHPLTSFDSLRASSAFIRRYEAPPKLLRRKLRLYAGTDVVADTMRLGLLDPMHRDGWRFKRSQIEGLDDWVNSFFGEVNGARDAVRTLEKAAARYGFSVEDSDALQLVRRRLDAMCLDYFDGLVDVCERLRVDAASQEVQTFHAGWLGDLEAYLKAAQIKERVREGYQRCGFPLESVDLFRR